MAGATALSFWGTEVGLGRREAGGGSGKKQEGLGGAGEGTIPVEGLAGSRECGSGPRTEARAFREKWPAQGPRPWLGKVPLDRELTHETRLCPETVETSHLCSSRAWMGGQIWAEHRVPGLEAFTPWDQALTWQSQSTRPGWVLGPQAWPVCKHLVIMITQVSSMWGTPESRRFREGLLKVMPESNFATCAIF